MGRIPLMAAAGILMGKLGGGLVQLVGVDCGLGRILLRQRRHQWWRHQLGGGRLRFGTHPPVHGSVGWGLIAVWVASP